MRVEKKIFSKRLYVGNDLNAKILSKDIIKKIYGDVDVIEPLNKYDIDLVIKKQGTPIGFAECEIKRCWKGYDFPFRSVHFPYRKKKNTLKKLPTIFIMFNSQLRRCLVVKAEDVKISTVKEVKNKLVNNGEMFYDVPISKVSFYEVE